jgi:hypothetical protein
VLVSRREKYTGDGVHDLWLTVGGSGGHGGLWNLRVEEGTVDDHFGGRRWDVQLLTTDAVKVDAIDRRREAKKARDREKLREDETALLQAIDAAAAAGIPCTRTYIRNRCSRLRGGALDAAIERLGSARRGG